MRKCLKLLVGEISGIAYLRHEDEGVVVGECYFVGGVNELRKGGNLFLGGRGCKRQSVPDQ